MRSVVIVTVMGALWPLIATPPPALWRTLPHRAEPLCDSRVDLQPSASHPVTARLNRRRLLDLGRRVRAPPVQQRVHCHQTMAVVDAHAVGGRRHLEHPLQRAVGHALQVAAHRDHAVVADAPLGAQHGVDAPGAAPSGWRAQWRSARPRRARCCRAAGHWPPCRATRAAGGSSLPGSRSCARGRSWRARSGTATRSCLWSLPCRPCRPAA